MFKKWRYRSQLLLKLRAIEVHFIEYRLDQLNNKHMKTAVNLTIQFFESRYQKFEVFWPTHHKITTL